MARKPLPLEIQSEIRTARKEGESYKVLAKRYNVSERTLMRVTAGVVAGRPADAVVRRVNAAIVQGAKVTIDGVDLTHHLTHDIERMTTAMESAEAKSFEGLAAVKLRYLQYLAQVCPPTLSDFVDQLIARPDFDPVEFVRLLKERYVEAN